MKLAAVIAAAGLSSRMRSFKPMLLLGGKTFIEHIIQRFRDTGVEEIVVVTGYKADVLRRHLSRLDVFTVNNQRFAETKMFDSLCMGLRAIRKPYDAVFLTPVDVPLVLPETLTLLKQSGAAMARPICGKVPGHPVLISAALIPQILSYSGDNGLLGAMKSMDEAIIDVKVDDIGITIDANIPKDYEVLCRHQMETLSIDCLWPDIHVHIMKGQVILTPVAAQFLEMIEHTGSIQGACTCVHMSYTTGWKLLNQMEKGLGYPLVAERFPDGANGDSSQLTEKGKRLLAAYQSYKEDMYETSNKLFQQYFTADLY